MREIAAGDRPEPMAINATSLVREALVGSGIDLVASCGVEQYDACAPEPWKSPSWLLGARGVVVVASAGPTLWRHLRAYLDEERSRWNEPHPLDTFVAGILRRVDESLSAASIPFRRFEPTLTAMPRIDFLALGRLVGLGSPGPFGMLIHPEHGAWWALRGAWLVAADVESPLVRRPPCSGCPAPCVLGLAPGGILQATAEIRGRCVVGTSSRYDDDQIAYHYDRPAPHEGPSKKA